MLYIPFSKAVMSETSIFRVQNEVAYQTVFSSQVEGEFVELWAKITHAGSKIRSELPLGNVLANEGLRLMSLVANKSTDEAKLPTCSVLTSCPHYKCHVCNYFQALYQDLSIRNR